MLGSQNESNLSLNMIVKLNKKQVIVVGTNALGIHGGGAAAQAFQDFGLKMGVHEGMSGKTYAFPTLSQDFKKRTRNQLITSRIMLYRECLRNPDKEYLLTPVGIGIAKYPVEYMKSLFTDPPKNLVLPQEFK